MSDTSLQMSEGAYSRVSKQVKRAAPTEDGIMMIDCTPLCRRLGLRWVDCGSVWFVKDICGVICAVFTYALIIYAQFVVMYVMLLPRLASLYSFFHGIVFNFGCFLAVASHVRAMLSDPGAVPKGNATRENIMRLDLKEGEVIFKCPKCVCIKPERAHHCSVCGRCIRKMDHHCPWVNNCIGENNQKYFVLFTMYICLISCHALYLSINHFVTCVNDNWKECMAVSPPATTVFLIFLVFEGLLFGIFTAIMCGSQLQSICTDETGIEQLKKEEASWEKKSYWMSLKEVFGHPFSIHWFSPFSQIQHGKRKMYMYAV